MMESTEMESNCLESNEMETDDNLETHDNLGTHDNLETHEKETFVTITDAKKEHYTMEWQCDKNQFVNFPTGTQTFQKFKVDKLELGKTVGRSSAWQFGIDGKNGYLRFHVLRRGSRTAEHDIQARLKLIVRDFVSGTLIFHESNDDYRSVFPVGEANSAVTWDEVIPINDLGQVAKNGLRFILNMTIFGGSESIPLHLLSEQVEEPAQFTSSVFITKSGKEENDTVKIRNGNLRNQIVSISRSELRDLSDYFKNILKPDNSGIVLEMITFSGLDERTFAEVTHYLAKKSISSGLDDDKLCKISIAAHNYGITGLEKLCADKINDEPDYQTFMNNNN